MRTGECCVISHLDVTPRAELEAALRATQDFIVATASQPGVAEITLCKEAAAANHFEMIFRYDSPEDYLRMLDSPHYLAFRSELSSRLGVPFDGRILRSENDQHWPSGTVGQFVTLTHLEFRPRLIDEQRGLLEQFLAVRTACSGRNPVLLTRVGSSWTFEVVTAWDSIEAFESTRASEEERGTRSAIECALVAPIDDRRLELHTGDWRHP